MPYASVVVPRPLDRTFSYSFPARWEGKVEVGSRVEVDFHGSRTPAWVVELTPGPPPGVPRHRIKPIQRVFEAPAALDAELLALGRELSTETMTDLGEVLSAFVPSYGSPRPPPSVRLLVSAEKARAEISARAKKQALGIESLIEAGSQGIPLAQFRKRVGASAYQGLEKKQLIGLEGEEIPPAPRADPRPLEAPEPPALTPLQEPIFAAIRDQIQGAKAETHLIHGITGSGKTEVYFRLFEWARARGLGCLFLVPEIALTVAMRRRVQARFPEGLAILHSKMTPRERYLEWMRIRAGEVSLVLGPRSAIFAPFTRLGVVVLDEEHETSYKQQDRPRYHARQVAEFRARWHGCPLVLGSATPSMESFHRGRSGAIRLHSLTQRFASRPLPEVEVVDMSQEFAQRSNRSIFSTRLRALIQSSTEAGGQVVLLMNRRGYHTYVFCRRCGTHQECDQCSLALTFHFEDQICRCHHCGRSWPALRVCPHCESRAIRYAGTGTQRVAREFHLNFPELRFARMDSDTTRRKGAYAEILRDFREHRTDVLVGTQMIAKGFDFPNLDLVGVIQADAGLKIPDFRGAERAFCLLTQVAGRAGRGEKPGRAIFQSYQPDHYVLQFAKKHDYLGFAEAELKIRKDLFYPPFSRLILVGNEGPSQGQAEAPLVALADELEADRNLEDIRVLGPVESPLRKLEGRYRFHLLLKVPLSMPLEGRLSETLRSFLGREDSARVDVDPQHLL